MNKNRSFTGVIVFPLPLMRQLERLSIPSEQRSKLSYFLSCFCDKVREFPASSELIHGFSYMFPRLLTVWDVMIQIRFNSLSRAQRQLNSDSIHLSRVRDLTQLLDSIFCGDIMFNSTQFKIREIKSDRFESLIRFVQISFFLWQWSLEKLSALQELQ